MRKLSNYLAWSRCKTAAVVITGLAALPLAGCERKERILDIDTPEGDVTVDRNIDTGEVEVDVNEE